MDRRVGGRGGGRGGGFYGADWDDIKDDLWISPSLRYSRFRYLRISQVEAPLRIWFR